MCAKEKMQPQVSIKLETLRSRVRRVTATQITDAVLNKRGNLKQ